MTKRYNTLKAEYRSISYQLADALQASDYKFNKATKKHGPRMKLLLKEIKDELAFIEMKKATVARLLPFGRPF